MLFALTRSILLRQLPHGNETILGLTETVTANHSIGTYFWGTCSGGAHPPEHVLFGNCSTPIFGGGHKIRHSATSSHKYMTLRSPRPYSSLMLLNWP